MGRNLAVRAGEDASARYVAVTLDGEPLRRAPANAPFGTRTGHLVDNCNGEYAWWRFSTWAKRDLPRARLRGVYDAYNPNFVDGETRRRARRDASRGVRGVRVYATTATTGPRAWAFLGLDDDEPAAVRPTQSRPCSARRQPRGIFEDRLRVVAEIVNLRGRPLSNSRRYETPPRIRRARISARRAFICGQEAGAWCIHRRFRHGGRLRARRELSAGAATTC